MEHQPQATAIEAEFHLAGIPCDHRRGQPPFERGCSRCYLNPLIKVSIYNQWLMVSDRQIGIVLNASHDKKLHWGAQRVNT